MPQRFDAGLLKKPERLDNGFLRADAFVTRVGVFRYVNADGTIRRELRLPDEVFSEKSLATLSMLPVTNEHPAGMVTADNARDLAVGSTGERAEQDGRFVRTKVQVTDGGVIQAVINGTRRELSCGYLCTKDATPGTTQGIPGVPDGEPYDVIQRDIRYNHLAVTERGRAGPEVSIPRMDGLDEDTAVMVLDDHPTRDKQHGELKMETITIDGVNYEVSTQAAQAIRKMIASHDSAVAELKKDLDVMTASADSAKEELDAEKKKREELEKKHDAAVAPEVIKDAVKVRVRLERDAAKVLGEKTEDGKPIDLDEMTDAEIRASVIKKVSPDQNLDDKSDDYIAARFDMAIEIATKDKGDETRDAADRSRDAVQRARQKDTGDDDANADTARDKMVKDQETRGRQPLEFGMSRNAKK